MVNVEQRLQTFLEQLQTPRVTFFPIRHHSPACAWHIRKLIQEIHPSAVLIEGPESLKQWIPYLVDEGLKPPVAFYMVWVDQKGKISKELLNESVGPTSPKFSAYFPICNYSPEFVAVREGYACGAKLEFIDLGYSQQILANRSIEEHPDDWRNLSLLHEAHLNSSNYVKELTRRTGCRDHDELWDHLFEIHATTTSTSQFIRNVASYCFLAREDYDSAILEFDGTLARERAMAGHIKEYLNQVEGHVLVITGGFHTANLPNLVTKVTMEPRTIDSADQAEFYLIRYSFEELDALNGYASGMPSPWYYNLVWSRLYQNHPDPYTEATAELLVEIGRLIRERQLPFSVSSADEIVALEQARLLAAMRGHRAPSREDCLDAVRSCFVKGSIDAEGVMLMKLIQASLSGNQTGQIPEGIPLPPLVANFHTTARQLRLQIENTTRRQTTLEIYKKPRHRKLSRLFHCLTFLGIPFARMLSGPDFIVGSGLDYLNETWEYSWSPSTDGALIQASVLGSTVEEAAATLLVEKLQQLETDGRGRSAGIAVGFLLRALQMGVHQYLDRILEEIEYGIAEDSDFNSLAEALRQLLMIHVAREPVEAAGLSSMNQLIDAAYRKGCFLVQDLYSKPIEQTELVVENLCTFGELIESPTQQALDSGLLYDSLKLLSTELQGNTGVIGAAWGLLYRADQVASEQVQVSLKGFLDAATVDNQDKTSFIYGLLRACREICWRDDWFIKTLDELWEQWDDSEFTRHLPELRLAFAGLTPGETDRVAEQAAQLHGMIDLGELVVQDVTESEIQRNLRINEIVRQSLKDDGLGIWLVKSQGGK